MNRIIKSKLTLLKGGRRDKIKKYWYSEFICECGNIKMIRERSVVSGQTKSCGKCNQRYIDLLGKKFNRLLVIGKSENKKGSACWECMCECGNKTIVPGWTLLKKLTKSCGCLKRNSGKNNPLWRGYGELSMHHWNSICNHAKIRDIKMNITIQDAWHKYEKQNKKCALTGQYISFPKSYKDKENKTASLDRIDSNRPYDIENIQWVHKDINWFKNNWSNNEFINLCKMVTQYNEVIKGDCDADTSEEIGA